MTTTPQTEASRLADGLLAETSKFGTPSIQRGLVNGAIQELRRLDAENQQLKKSLALVQQHHATAWNRGYKAGLMAGESVVKQATDAVKADAWGNTQLTNALMQSEAERDQLRAQVERLQATEPFGYFRVDALGWTDCAATDEGAIALYERPAAPAAPSQEPDVPQGFKPVGYLRSDEFDGHMFEPIDGTWPFDELLFSLSTSPEPVQEVTLTDEAVNAAAKVLAERFDYPWEHMPEEGRKNMRVQARAVVIAALRAKGALR